MLVLLLPATVHYYVVVVSVAVAILLGKHAFGGYGHYPFNPAAFGYAVAAVSWPGEVFLYPVPFTTMSVLDTGSATVMESVSTRCDAGGAQLDVRPHPSGNYAGPSAPLRWLILVACAMYLWMRDITLGHPFRFSALLRAGGVFLPACEHAGAGAALAVSGHPPALAQIRDALRRAYFCGLFLVNEPVTRPKNTRAHFVYGMILGFMTMMFRYFGSYDTGVCLRCWR